MAANSYNSDVKKVFEIFGKRMFKEFDQIVACVHERLNKKVSSKTSTALKFIGDLTTLWESPCATVRDTVKRGVGEKTDARKLRDASKLANLAYKWSEEEGVQMRETLCQAALVLYVSFYSNITRVTTKHGTDRKAIETLAKVAVSNFISWYLNQPDEKPFSVEIITEGVTTNMKASSLFQPEQTMVYDKVTKTEYNPIKLFTKTALVVDDESSAQTYYGKQSMKLPSKYGYRFLFEHEMENKSVVLNEHKQILDPDINLVKPELDKGTWRELLNAIREEDPNNMESRLKEHMEQTIQHNYRTVNTDIDYCPAPVSTFLGRYEELETLKTLFSQNQVVAVVGMGGLGKTQLSRKYVQVNKADYQYKYWLEAETPEKLENSFKKFAKKLHVESNSIDNEVVNDVYKKIQAVSTILVFDNVEKPEHVYAYLPTRVDLPPGVTIHVLVTSRWADWTCDEQIQCYNLQPFNISTSLQIFQRKFGETCTETMKNEWKELARMLGYLPLALQVATSYIHKRNKHNSNLGTVLADYMKQLKEGADRLLNDPLPEYGNRSVYASMLLTLIQLENRTHNTWKLAVTLINAAAYMYPDRIYKEHLLKLLNNNDNPCILHEALGILTEYSLFNQGVSRGGYAYYTVHRIIQTSIRHNQTLMGTADMYYNGALKYAFADAIATVHVFQYANERAAAVGHYYKENPSLELLKYLVTCKAITAMQAVLKLMTRSQIQSQIHDLLYYAVWSEDLSMIQLLCSNGADINQLSRMYDESPLHRALRVKNMEIATWLLENGAALSVRGINGYTALHVASMMANHEMVSIIIKTDRATVNETGNYGSKTPLHTIDYSNNKENILSTIRVLVESGADITAVDEVGNTVLHYAARGACAAAVPLILQLNKDFINIVNKYGETALHSIPYVSVLMDDERILSTIRVLAQSGVDLTKVDIRGNTVLHSATKGARVGAVSLFLQLNKYLTNSVNKAGETALHVIPYHNKYVDDECILSIIRVLVQSGVDLTKVDIRGNTVLHSAAKGASAEVVSLILQRNKDLISIKNEDGQTALHVLGNGYKSILEYELEEKIQQLFARMKETARVLIMNGLSLDTRDNKGCTPLDTVIPVFKDILLQVADECNYPLLVRAVNAKERSDCCAVL